MLLKNKIARRVIFLSPIIIFILWIWISGLIWGTKTPNTLIVGRISKVKISYNPKYSRTFLNYQFTANGEIYENSVTSENLREEMHIFDKRYFPVLYFDEDPSISTILISKQNFLDNGISFPDSLEWVCKYIDCDVGL